MIVGSQGGGWEGAEASRVPSITPLSEREGRGKEVGLGVTKRKKRDKGWE